MNRSPTYNADRLSFLVSLLPDYAAALAHAYNTMLPSEYFKRQCYIALDVDEDPASMSSTRWALNIGPIRTLPRSSPQSEAR